MWQNINLSGFGLVRYVVTGRLGAWPHWTPVQGPSTPTGSPWGVTFLTKARQVTEMRSEACYIPLALLWMTACSLYLCCLITFSCTHCREMLYGLCFLLTNLHISFHHQSDVLLQQGTTFVKLLLSPEIRNVVEKVCQRYIWAQVNQTKLGTGLGNSMSLVGVGVSLGLMGV